MSSAQIPNLAVRCSSTMQNSLSPLQKGRELLPFHVTAHKVRALSELHRPSFVSSLELLNPPMHFCVAVVKLVLSYTKSFVNIIPFRLDRRRSTNTSISF